MTGNGSSAGLSEERLEILRLVENQTITAEEAGRLLEALDRSDRSHDAAAETLPFRPFTPPGPPGPPGPMGPPPTSVRIRITDTATGVARINLVLPYRLVDSGVKLAKRIAGDQLLEGRDIRRSIKSGFQGPLLDITDDNQRVEIIIEEAAPPGLRINQPPRTLDPDGDA